MTDTARSFSPLHPSAALLCKLGSMIVHVEEAASEDGHHFDIEALKQLATDPEVTEWLVEMGKLGMLPVKRR